MAVPNIIGTQPAGNLAASLLDANWAACLLLDGSQVATGAIVFSTGTAGAPALTFAGDLDTGWYWIGANNIGGAVGGAKRLDLGTGYLGYTGASHSTYLLDSASTSLIANTSTANSEFVSLNATAHEVGFGVSNGTSLFVSKSGTGSILANTTGAGSEYIILDSAHTLTLGVSNASRLVASVGAASTSGIRLVDYTTNGTVTTTGGTGVLSSASDERLKIDDGLLDPAAALAMVMKLQPRYYFWKGEREEKGDQAQRQLGHFAQNVNAACGDEAANLPAEPDGMMGYYDRSVMAVLVAAFQKLSADFDAYKAAHP